MTRNIRITKSTNARLLTLKKRFKFSSRDEVINNLINYWNQIKRERGDLTLKPTIYKKEMWRNTMQYNPSIATHELLTAFGKSVHNEHLTSYEKLVSSLINFHKAARLHSYSHKGFYSHNEYDASPKGNINP